MHLYFRLPLVSDFETILFVIYNTCVQDSQYSSNLVNTSLVPSDVCSRQTYQNTLSQHLLQWRSNVGTRTKILYHCQTFCHCFQLLLARLSSTTSNFMGSKFTWGNMNGVAATGSVSSGSVIKMAAIYITLEGIEKRKPEKKMTTKQSAEYFFLQCCKKNPGTNTVMAILIGGLHCTIIWFLHFTCLFQWDKIQFGWQNNQQSDDNRHLKHFWVIRMKEAKMSTQVSHHCSALWRDIILWFCLGKCGEILNISNQELNLQLLCPAKLLCDKSSWLNQYWTNVWCLLCLALDR